MGDLIVQLRSAKFSVKMGTPEWFLLEAMAVALEFLVEVASGSSDLQAQVGELGETVAQLQDDIAEVKRRTKSLG